MKTLKILPVSIITFKSFLIQSFNNLSHKDALSPFHINTCSLSKYIEELDYLIDKIKIEFDVIGISESRIKKYNKFERLRL